MPAGFAGLRPGALAATLLVWPALVSSGPTLDPRRAEVTFAVREFQPQVPYAGRMNGIAVHPADDNVVIVASDTGGLFRSRDRGASFEHVRSFPAWSVWDVSFHPGDPSVVLATSARDFRGSGAGGGIWRSANGGVSWSKPATANPPAVGACQAGAAAYKIAVEPGSGTVFVTTECGIARSRDRGATWTHQRFSGPAPFEPRYRAVTALGGGRAVAAGPGGIAQSVDGGVNWWPITSGVGAVNSYQALARSPYYRDDVYVINSALELWASSDAGRTWGRLPTGSVEGRGACGGFEFVRVVPRDRRSSWFLLEEPGLDLYLGNQCFVFRSHARRPFWSFFRPVYSGGWSRLGIDHDDTRDLAFFGNGRPAFLSTDGGLHRTGDDGATWPLTASGAGGLNALQLYEVTGQQIETPRRHDLYIGTQDNNLWSSADTGRTWPFQQFWEGAGIFLEPRVAREELSHVTYWTCGPCATLQSGANFRDPIDWPDAQPGFSSPVLVGPGAHVQQTGPLDSDRTRAFGLSLTSDLGVRWSEAVASFGVATAQLPKVSRYGPTPVFYQAYRQGTDPTGNAVFWLARVSGVLESSGPVRPVFPRMTGFGSIGVHPTMFVWSQVFGVDPWDPMHLIAADVGSGAMMRSTDGGESWSRLDALTNLVTKGGALQFTLDLGDLPFSLGSAVGFSPQDPNMVLVGAFEGGLYFSFDRGETWQLVPNSERIPRVTAFHWQTQSTVFVSSYGRGLWRLSISLRYPTDLFGVGCGKCTAFDLQGLPTQGFDRALVAFSGRVSDATAKAGQLVSLAVTPGTATLLFSDAKGDTFEPPEEKADLGAFDGLDVAAKLAAQGLVVRGVTFSQGKLSGVVASEKEEELGEPGPFLEFKDEGDPTPGNEGKPYVEVATAETVSGIPVALPSGVVDVVGRGFKAVGLRPVELQVDGRAVPGKRIQVRKDGSFRVRVRLRALGLRPGIHSIAALQRHGQTIVLRDAGPFGVRHDDNFGERKDEGQGPDKP